MNPLDLDEEFNFVEWQMEKSVKDQFEEDEDIDDARSILTKNLKKENGICQKVLLYDFLALEKQRMAEIEKLIPNYSKLRVDVKDKTGQTLSYYRGLIEGCSIGHYVPAYNYNDYY